MARFTDADLAKLKKLHAKQVGRNEIAKRLGFSPGTVSLHAIKAGLSFDQREILAVAVRTHQLSLAERRARLATKLMDLAEKAAEDIAQAYETIQLGMDAGASQWMSITSEVPPAKERLDLAKIAALASSQSLKLIEFDTKGEDGAAEARGMLLELSDAARALAATIPAAPTSAE